MRRASRRLATREEEYLPSLPNDACADRRTPPLQARATFSLAGANAPDSDERAGAAAPATAQSSVSTSINRRTGVERDRPPRL